jgi:hypothetical protein
LAQSCTTERARLLQSSSERGRIEAGILLPDLPGDCRFQEPHAAITEGAEARSVLIRERGQLDKANARVGRCADNYGSLKIKMEKR